MSAVSPDAYRPIGAKTFEAQEVVDAYGARPAYPPNAVRYLLEHALSEATGSEPAPRILDAGCGNGLLTEAIARCGVREIVALDISKPMINAFRMNIQPPLPAVLGSFDDMPFRDSSFDLAVFGSALHWANPSRLPTELHRILRPNGCVASVTNTTRDNTEFTDILFRLPNHAAQDNPMTSNPQGIDLGPNFDFELFRSFPNDRLMTAQRFGELLMSIDPLQNAPSTLRHQTEAALWDYARRHTVDGLIVAPYETFVSIARAK